MREIDQELQAADKLLTVLLSGGRRNAGSTLDALREAAESLAMHGLDATAELLRAVAEAPDAASSLSAVTLASAAIALLRARLPDISSPEGEWTPLVEKGSSASRPRLLLLAQAYMDGATTWVALRSSNSKLGLVLVDLPDDVALQANLVPGTQIAVTLEWQSTMLIGSYSIRRFAGNKVESAEQKPAKMLAEQWGDVFAQLDGTSVQAKLREGDLRPERRSDEGLLALDVNDALHTGTRWLDPSMQAAWGEALRPGLKALCWVDGGSIFPLALVEPGAPATHVRVGVFRLFSKETAAIPAKLVHLLPGHPVVELG